MLPFSKWKATSDEVELSDDDLVLVEEIALPARLASPQPSSSSSSSSSHSSSSSQSHVRAALARPPRGAALPPGSRRVIDERVEEDVAGQCLASIAAATSVVPARHLGSSSHLRAAFEAAPAPVFSPPVAHAASSVSSSRGSTRLPSVTAPPFVRTSTHPLPSDGDSRALRSAPQVPGIRESSPPAAFIRRSTPALGYPVASASLPPSAPSSVVATNAGAFGSIAPVSMTSLPQAAQEPTVIVVRERPRSVWILAAAACGAFCAIGAMRFAPMNGGGGIGTQTGAAVQPAAPLPLPPTAVVAPIMSAPLAAASSASAAVAPAASAAPASAVMNFAEDEGVAIRVPALAAPAAPRKPAGAASGVQAPSAARPGPRVPFMGPALPDGSFGLGRSDTTTATAPPSLTSTPPAPEPPRKRALTPEQQLADAQLKASMK